MHASACRAVQHTLDLAHLGILRAEYEGAILVDHDTVPV
jgi:hypothetical protein